MRRNRIDYPFQTRVRIIFRKGRLKKRVEFNDTHSKMWNKCLKKLEKLARKAVKRPKAYCAQMKIKFEKRRLRASNLDRVVIKSLVWNSLKRVPQISNYLQILAKKEKKRKLEEHKIRKAKVDSHRTSFNCPAYVFRNAKIYVHILQVQKRRRLKAQKC